MISIVMPIYNAKDTLSEAIDSALQSGVANQEIILVDDGSTDGSWDLISQYHVNNNSIKIHRNKRNRGGGAARNIGISQAKNELIFVLDSDDILVPGSLPRAIDLLEKTRADGIANGFASCFVDDLTNPSLTYRFKSGWGKFEDLISPSPNPFIGNLLFTKTAYNLAGGYPEHHGFDTQGFGYRLLAANCKIYTPDFQLYHQRLPSRPSYYIREVKGGNLLRNWFLIFIEFLYKFRPDIQDVILNYDYRNPKKVAIGKSLFVDLSTLAMKENIFDSLRKNIGMVEFINDVEGDPTGYDRLNLIIYLATRGKITEAIKIAEKIDNQALFDKINSLIILIAFGIHGSLIHLEDLLTELDSKKIKNGKRLEIFIARVSNKIKRLLRREY
ncbi:glycosyltransferase [Oxalobacter vibrioformis]|uniref:Glycosyltransferase n=1 Tax=Oxalobacter vibrioformis TaxID=933080 RepID=A0A9E9P2K5_9BURK|nr:glycosyltransferase family 2 protein [Oxalobacter vibrioformis]WAW09103.1 glycosyltransferase [Oxalobacter vibrioformis]